MHRLATAVALTLGRQDGGPPCFVMTCNACYALSLRTLVVDVATCILSLLILSLLWALPASPLVDHIQGWLFI